MTSDDLTMRAPYISMDEQDDLPLLTADGNVMWNQYNENIPMIHHPEMKDSNIINQMNSNNQQVIVDTTPTTSSASLSPSSSSTTTSGATNTANDMNCIIENIMQLQQTHHHQQQHPQQQHHQNTPQQLLGPIAAHRINDIENIENIIINARS